MERFFHKHILHISFVIFFTSFVVFSSQVLAVGSPAEIGKVNRPFIATGGAKLLPPRMPAFAQNRLQQAKLKVCQALSKNIATRSAHMNDRVLKMEETFDSIAQGVENHYLTKLVPQGMIVLNYDALVADIQTQKSALTPLLAAIQTDIANFSCTGNNPAAQLTQYRTDMQAVIQGLHAYKKAVRNLIVAVARVRGTAERNAKPASGSARNSGVFKTALPAPVSNQ